MAFLSIQEPHFGGLAARLYDLAIDAEDLYEPLWYSAKFIQGMTMENIEQQGALVGGWEPLSEGYERWKESQFPGRPMMVLYGWLVEAAEDEGAIEIDDANNEAMYTIQDQKAPWHHFGDEDRGGKGGRLPARPLIPDDDVVIEQIADFFVDYVDESLDKVRRGR